MSRLLLRPLRTEPFPWEYSKSLWLAIWGVWDSGWYLDIAKFGYSTARRSGPEILNQANYAFFPLYPLSMRALGPLFGGPFNAGLVVSNVCLVVACFALLRLVRSRHGDRVARRAVKYFVLFPTAFILSGVFSESLFLALSILAFCWVAEDRLWPAATAAFLASLTRSVGVLLVIPLVLEYWNRRRVLQLPLERRGLALFLAPLGFVAFGAYNYFLTGDSLAFIRIQSSWNRGLHSPLSVLASGLVHPDVNKSFSAWMTLLVLGFLLAFVRRVGFPFAVLSLLLIAVPLATGLDSMPRYLLAVFPVPILLATLARKPLVDDAVTGAFAILQGCLMVFWASGFKLVV
ncbi:MAG: mannosyltransferase family protein [Thermoanaerobaculia bacterium]